MFFRFVHFVYSKILLPVSPRAEIPGLVSGVNYSLAVLVVLAQR